MGELGSPAALGYRYDDDDGPFAADLVLPAGDLITEKLRAYRRLDPRLTARAAERPAADRSAVRRRDLRRGRRERPGRIARPADRNFRAARPSARRHRRRRRWHSAPTGQTPKQHGAMSARCSAISRRRSTPPPASACSSIATSCRRARGLNDPSYATSVSFFGGEHVEPRRSRRACGPRGAWRHVGVYRSDAGAGADGSTAQSPQPTG